ncbi:DUF1616 domain-containing protein [Halopiger xanaduensis]|uniref:DUF1616 domain-containing protein n=1 Tax=Halopiger xanaduensis (strain DSM 18323 / JCM 14033 / SH-6) TaxID=797210 RepID=F8DD40_HALXS|nr:DUF1616 domain-containing protein [Halopiger xanaduensis]AEH38927.1 protein of unknown function DUF1616 [Halopiger xanaduensis SH-6]
MEDRRIQRFDVPDRARRLPADLAAAVVVTGLVNGAVFVPILRETPLRIPLGLVFVLFVPGYVSVAALFPEDGTAIATSATSGQSRETSWGLSPLHRPGINRLERIALSFGGSLAVVPLIGLALNFTPWGVRLIPITLALTSFTIAMTAIAAVRRWRLSDEDRFRIPYREWYRAGRSELFESPSRRGTILNVLLVASVVLAAGTVSFAVVVSQESEQYSAVYLLSETEDGELVADNYTTEFAHGESQPITVGVDNHEYEATNYTVVLLEQSVTVDDNETIVEAQRELDRFETRLAHNETWRHQHRLEPTMTAENTRFVWLLYPGGNDIVPDEPSIDTAEYHVHLWVNDAET